MNIQSTRNKFRASNQSESIKASNPTISDKLKKSNTIVVSPGVEHSKLKQLNYLEFLKEAIKTKQYKGLKHSEIRAAIKDKYAEYKELMTNHNREESECIGDLCSKYNESKPLEIIGLEYN